MTTEPVKKSTLGNIILLVITILVTFVVLEIGYRIRFSQRSVYNYNVVSAPFYGFSKELGYNYLPNKKAVAASVRNNVVVFWRDIDVGPYGNLGNGVTSWTDEDMRILAFGDSFTSNPFTLHSWADHAPAAITEAVGRKAQVINLGREGYGVLQIIHNAAMRAKEFSPDLLIITFIKNDITRGRFWRTQFALDGMKRMFTSFAPDSLPSIEKANDVIMLNPGLTREWCEKMISGGTKDDPFLATLNRQFDRLREDNISKSLYTLTHSFLIDRIRFGDPQQRLRKATAFLPRISLTDYGEDSTFLSDAAILKGLSIPWMVVMLPEIDDLKVGANLLNLQDSLLVQSIEKHLSTQVVRLFGFLDPIDSDVSKYFASAHDYHSSKLGAQLYARAIARAVEARYGDVLRKPKSKTVAVRE